GTDLNPDELNTLGLPTKASLAPLAQALGAIHAHLQPTVPKKFFAKLNLRRLYTVRFAPGVHKTTFELNGIAAALRALRVSVVARVSLVPAARPPTDDPFLGAGRKTTVNSETSPCGTQWYMYASDAPTAWACDATGKGVVVADLDWGFMVDHEDLKGAFD